MKGGKNMQCITRYDKYHEEPFDSIILKIRNGTIKCGKYAHMVKIDKNKIVKRKELFTNGEND
jgi:hypothetical protein